MARRHIFILCLAAAAAIAVSALLFVMRSRRPPPPGPPSRSPEPVLERPLDIDPRLALLVTRIFGKAAVHPPTVAPYWLAAEDALSARMLVDVPEDSVALLATGGGDELLLRGGARARCWLETDGPSIFLERGELHLDATGTWTLQSAQAVLRMTGGACALRLSPQGAHVAVTRGTVLVTSGQTPAEILEGELADARDGRISSSSVSDIAPVLAWTRAAWDARNVLKGGPVAVKPSARYYLRGRATEGGVSVRAGDATVAGWTSLPHRFGATFTTPPGAREITIEGKLGDGALVEVGSD